MDKYFYIDSNGVQKGPVDVDRLKKLGLPPYTLIWKKGMREWSEFSTLIALDTKKTTETAIQERRQTSKTTTTTATTTTTTTPTKSSTSSTSYAATLSSTVNKPTTKATSSNEKSGQSKTSTAAATDKSQTSSESKQDKYKIGAVIHMIVLLVFYLPLALIYQARIKGVITETGFSLPALHGPIGGFALVIFLIIRYWPLIAIIIAGILAMRSYYKRDCVEDAKGYLYISVTISIATIILGIFMMFYPVATLIIMGIALAVFVLISYFSD